VHALGQTQSVPVQLERAHRHGRVGVSVEASGEAVHVLSHMLRHARVVEVRGPQDRWRFEELRPEDALRVLDCMLNLSR
jgi:hypothetical protein